MIKIFVLLMFGSITVISSLSLSLPVWYILGFMALLFGVVAYYIVRLTRLRRRYPAES